MLHFFCGFCTVFSRAPPHSLSCHELPHSNFHNCLWGKKTSAQQGKDAWEHSSKIQYHIHRNSVQSFAKQMQALFEEQWVKRQQFSWTEGFFKKTHPSSKTKSWIWPLALSQRVNTGCRWSRIPKALCIAHDVSALDTCL